MIISIPNVGSPPDDPHCILPGFLCVPSTPQPWKCVVGTVAALFRNSYNLSPIKHAFKDLSNAGFLCLAQYVRLLTPIPTQTTSGAWHHQSDDLKIGIRAMRSNPFNKGYNVTGFVATLGGSGSATAALTDAIEGTAGNDRADAGICMSPPADFSDRSPDVTDQFIRGTEGYAQTTDIPTLRARSPIALDLPNSAPILHYNGNAEHMPLSQLTRFSAAMNAAGVKNYTPIENTGVVGTLHSFDMWLYIKADVISWLHSL